MTAIKDLTPQHRAQLVKAFEPIAAGCREWLRAHPHAPGNMIIVIARETVVPEAEPPHESRPEAHRARGPPNTFDAGRFAYELAEKFILCCC
jgi:hypothetical protein